MKVLSHQAVSDSLKHHLYHYQNPGIRRNDAYYFSIAEWMTDINRTDRIVYTNSEDETV